MRLSQSNMLQMHYKWLPINLSNDNIQEDHHLSKYIIFLNSCTASLTKDNLTQHMSRVSKMNLQNFRVTRKFARLGADFTSMNNGNRHITLVKQEESQKPDKIKGGLLLPLQIRDSSNGEWILPYATTSPNMYSLILDSS